MSVMKRIVLRPNLKELLGKQLEFLRTAHLRFTKPFVHSGPIKLRYPVVEIAILPNAVEFLVLLYTPKEVFKVPGGIEMLPKRKAQALLRNSTGLSLNDTLLENLPGTLYLCLETKRSGAIEHSIEFELDYEKYYLRRASSL